MEDESEATSVLLPDPAELRRILVTCFNVDELRNLCQDLGIDYELLPRDNKEAIARELVAYCQRHTRTSDLTAAINRAKPEPPTPGECPYKGLQYFDVDDAHLFFGRERLTAELVGRLRQDRFLAVVGASGSGKSSVVRAGLAPALKRGDPLADGTLPPEGSTWWRIHIITPTAHPLEALAASLARDSESVTATATLMDDLVRDARSLHLYVRKVLSSGALDAQRGRLLLVVDQFEELFTACNTEVERKAFVDNLLYASAPETEGPTIVVIALRADFYAHCAQFDNLREVLTKRQDYIGPMSADELRRAIEEPARRNGWDLEPGLTGLLLRDVGDEPGALPLLSHALLATWKRRQGHMLTLARYAESGGVHGAIAKTAETVFNQLEPEQQDVARSIFLRLTEFGDSMQDTRRRVGLSELVPRPEEEPAVESLLKTLADARLIVTAEQTVEIAHEALIREWPRLRRWLAENREGLLIQRHLTRAAQNWQKSDRDKSDLYSGKRLEQATKWAKDHTYELTTLEREFLDASRAVQARQLIERRAWQSISAALAIIAIVTIAWMFGQSKAIRQAGTELTLTPRPACNGDFSGLMPEGWAFISQTPLDTDGVAPIECVVLYRFDIQTKMGQKNTPVGGVVYRQDHGKPRSIYAYPLTPPGNFYLGERQVSARVGNVLSGSPEPELLIEDRDGGGTVVQVSLFGWRDNKQDQPDADPSFNPDIMSYKPLGLFQGDGGVTVEKDKVTSLVRRKDTRSQLADRKVYLPRADKKNYYGQSITESLTAAETDVTSLAMGDDPTASPYPEKTVLAFYRDVKEDTKLEGLMTPDLLGSLKANKLAYGCVPDRAQLDRPLVQTINWNGGNEAEPQVIVGGKCKLKDGSVKDMPVTTWLLEKNPEGKWRLKGVAP